MGSFAEGLVGLTLDDRYRLDGVLGEGGMGAVFRATHLAMERKVAVKLLKPHLTSNEASLQRFLREARSTMKVDSPHAVKVLDYGVTPLRDYYMVLEYLDGRTVQRELDVDGVFDPDRVVHIARQALHALGKAHAMGLIHRDIKPENIFLMRVGTDADFTKLLDFGVAKLMEGAARSDQSQLALTQVGTVFGTPEFMSPEQACGHPLDGRSDLYSLAATMFAMLTGCGLFEAVNAIDWLTHHVRTPPPRLADLRPELAAHPALERIIQQCLAKQREKRPASAEELDAQLAQIEAELAAPAAAPAPPRASRSDRARVFSTSTFFEALPRDTVDPGATLMPSALVASSTSGMVRAIKPRRTGVVLGIAVLVLLGGISVAVGVAVSRSDSAGRAASTPDAAIARALDAGPADAPRPVVALDAPARDAPVDPIDAAPPPIDAGARPAPKRPEPNTAALAQYLKEAEAALAEGRAMAQMGAAQLALEADPRSARARYLYGDALIKNNYKDQGCAYLRALRRYPLAISRANAAGCPN